MSGNGCTTLKGRQPWIPRGINTWGECSICFRLYEQKWNCKYIFEPFLNSCYKIGFIFLHANQQLYAGPCSLCPLKAGLSGKIKTFKGIFCFKCFVCSAKTCWDAEDKVFLEIKLTPVSTGSLYSETIRHLSLLWGKWPSWQMEAHFFLLTRLVLSHRGTMERKCSLVSVTVGTQPLFFSQKVYSTSSTRAFCFLAFLFPWKRAFPCFYYGI